MTTLHDLLSKNEGNKRAAAYDLCVGVMSHDPSDPLRQGYSLGNALIMAQEMFDLTATEVAVLADRLVAPLVTAAAEAYRVDSISSAVLRMGDALEKFGIDR
jgi:hypothetical protein